MKSIQITLAARLEKFNLSSLAALTAADDLDLHIGRKKVALFALIPDNDTSYNFLVSILYTQFSAVILSCRPQIRRQAPVHVHFLMDEFQMFHCRMTLTRSFGHAVQRSERIHHPAESGAVKSLFEKQWESIMGNADEFLYLGGNEQGTHKYVSELLGKKRLI